MKELSTVLKAELVMFVLERTPIWHFNRNIREFSVQPLYARCKRELMSSYPELMNGNMSYAIVMSDAFADYKCDEIRCPDLRRKIDSLKYNLKYYKKFRPQEYAPKVKEHNDLIDEYMDLLQPQNNLVALYKKVVKKQRMAETLK